MKNLGSSFQDGKISTNTYELCFPLSPSSYYKGSSFLWTLTQTPSRSCNLKHLWSLCFLGILIILQVMYKENLGTGIPTTITPEIERVKRNQENFSSVFMNIWTKKFFPIKKKTTRITYQPPFHSNILMALCVCVSPSDESPLAPSRMPTLLIAL